MITVGGVQIPLAFMISVITSVLIPGVALLATREHWSKDVPQNITVALSIAAGFLSQLAAHPNHFHTWSAVGTALTAYVLAAISNSQYWRKSNTGKKLLAVGSRRPRLRH